MSIDVSVGKMAICGSTCTYHEYRMHEPKQESIESDTKHIGKEALVKLWKGVSYDDTL